MISCGNCKKKHETVAQVKACFAAKYAKPQAQVAVLEQPKPKAAEAATVPGMYTKNGQVFRVKSSKAGYLYAQLVTMFDGKPTYTYAPKVFKSLTVDDKMSLEDAEAYSLKINHCCCCGLTLTNTKSVALGIGPVCRKKYF